MYYQIISFTSTFNPILLKKNLKLIGQYAIVVFIIIFGFVSINFIITLFDGYKFETVSKIPIKYNEPAFLFFHWDIEAEELMTGQKATVTVEAVNLPYNMTSNLIQVKFEGVGHWKGDESTNLIERISTVENATLSLKQKESQVFKSDPISIRYAVEGVKKITFCDYHLEKPCVTVDSIVEVAPHVKTFEIEIARIGSVVGSIIVILISLSLLITYRKNILENHVK